MEITGILKTARTLLKYLDIDPNKFDINCNLVLLFYKKKHGKQYAFLTDQYCDDCIYFCNMFELATNDEDISIYINRFAAHILFSHTNNVLIKTFI